MITKIKMWLLAKLGELEFKRAFGVSLNDLVADLGNEPPEEIKKHWAEIDKQKAEAA